MASKDKSIEEELLYSVENDKELIKKVTAIANQAGAQLVDSINKSIGASAHSDVIGTASLCGVTVNGLEATIEVNISNGYPHESLVPWKYGGIVDMTSLFDKGYHARRQVYGMWHDKYVGSVTDRDGEGFIKSGVESFSSGSNSGYTVISKEYNKDRFK